MSWIDRFFAPKENAVADSLVDKQDRARIRLDLGSLDKLRPQLGEQLVSYICDGQNDSILLTARPPNGPWTTIVDEVEPAKSFREVT